MTISAQRFYLPIPQIFTDTGILAPGYQLFFYQTGTTTPLAVYSDTTLMTSLPNPVLTNNTGHLIDGSGNITNIYFSDASLYKAVLEDENGVVKWTADPCDPFSVSVATLSPRPVYYAGLTTGTSSAYVLASTPPFLSYASSDSFELTFHTACAAAPTLQYVSTGAALNLKKYNGQGAKVALLAGDVENQTHLVRNDGTDIVVLDPRTVMTYLGAPPTISVSSNVLTLTNVGSSYNVNTGSGAQTINTINGLTSGQIAVIGISSSSHAATFAMAADNILNPFGINAVLTSVNDKIIIYYDGTNNLIISSGANKQFLASPTTNGYQYLPSGLILQWGQYTQTVGGGGFTAITFPIAFPTACLNVHVTVTDTDSTTLSNSFSTVVSQSTTGATIGWDRTGSFWFAIGN